MESNPNKWRILIIEDDEMQLIALQTTLGSEGYSVHSTADGPQGIAIFKELKPDLVLLDIGHPSMSGIEVLHEIRKIEAEAKVIVITGYGSVETAVLAIRSGAVDYVQKPYDVQLLLEKISTALGMKNRQRN